MLRYLLTRIAFFAGGIGLIVAAEWLVTASLGFRRTQLTFFATTGVLLVLARWPLRSFLADRFGGLWRAHLRWAKLRPWLASAADGAMVFAFVLPFAVIDGYGFVYSVWNAAVCGGMIGGLTGAVVLLDRRKRRRQPADPDAARR